MSFAKSVGSLSLVIALGLVPLTGYAASDISAHWADHIVISELQVASLASASQEFVELYNPTDQPVSVDGWTVEYKSATAVDAPTNWKAKATLTGKVAPYGHYLVATRGYLSDADAEWTASLAATAGAIRVVSGGETIDSLSYGSTLTADIAATAPVAGGSIERLPGRRGGNGQDTNISAADFAVVSSVSPQSSKSPSEPPASAELDEPVADQIPVVVNDPVIEPVAPIVITEILPDPASPLTDANDEFVELYNSGATPVQLNGYELRVGLDGKARYRLPALTIAAQSYLLVYSRDIDFSLANGGGMVALFDVTGRELSTTAPYPESEEGASWGLLNGMWQWSVLPSPGADNRMGAPLAAVVTTTKAVAPKAAKKSTVTIKKTALPKAPKVTKVKAKLAAKTAKSGYIPAGFINHQPGTWLLIALGCLTIAYAIYEFRYDVYHYYNKLRGNRAARFKDQPSPEGE